MSRKLISAAHSLQLVPVYNIIHFGIVHSKVVIRSIGKPDILMIVPGTLKPGDSKNEDVYTKKHTFKLADVSQNKTLYLENLKVTPFVALYTDDQRLLALSNPFSHVFSSMGEAFTLSMKMII